jgi:hypothetical protein
VVGLAASAGGLEALETFFGRVGADTGMSYVVVQHLSPDHRSLMAETRGPHARDSLEGLVVLEPEIVKIDRRYVNGLAQDTSRRRIFRRLMQVAESLNATVIAEGLEDPEDVQALLDLGVQYAQGYLLGRPTPLGDA